MIDNLSTVQFTTHEVCINVNEVTERIYVFKHSDTTCDFEMFDCFDEATAFINAPLV